MGISQLIVDLRSALQSIPGDKTTRKPIFDRTSDHVVNVDPFRVVIVDGTLPKDIPQFTACGNANAIGTVVVVDSLDGRIARRTHDVDRIGSYEGFGACPPQGTILVHGRSPHQGTLPDTRFLSRARIVVSIGRQKRTEPTIHPHIHCRVGIADDQDSIRYLRTTYDLPSGPRKLDVDQTFIRWIGGVLCCGGKCEIR